MKIGIIGGTGVNKSSFIENVENINVETPYGIVELVSGHRNDTEIFFLERHSKCHKLTPSRVNYRANIYAMKLLNIDYIISTAAVGAINSCNTGDFVLINDFIDFTKNRTYTFFDSDDNGVVHVDMSNPYCETIRKMLGDSFKVLGIPYIPKGTYICTEGPRFETPAEIQMYKLLGGNVVGMTNVPEVILARECALCYATIALVTNFAAGISNSELTHKEVSETMIAMSDKLEKVLINFIDNVSQNKICSCNDALKELNTLK